MTAAEKAQARLEGVRKLHDEWALVIGGFDEAALRAPSALPDWTRAHVLAHVARNADGLRNLLIWAHTGVETPMYASAQAREDDIQAGARQSAPELLADVVASAGRFDAYAAGLPPSAWTGEARNRQGDPVTGAVVARMRLSEVTIHLADLASGYDLDRALGLAGPLTEDVVQHAIDSRAAVLPPLTLEAGGLRWTTGPGPVVRGTPGAVLGWLTGRTDGSDLEGDVPRLPAWS